MSFCIVQKRKPHKSRFPQTTNSEQWSNKCYSFKIAVNGINLIGISIQPLQIFIAMLVNCQQVYLHLEYLKKQSEYHISLKICRKIAGLLLAECLICDIMYNLLANEFEIIHAFFCQNKWLKHMLNTSWNVTQQINK